MKDERLTHCGVFGETPEILVTRVIRTLSDVKEKKPTKKRFSGVLITALVLMLLCAAALAAVNGVGLDWYYKNIFPNHPLPKNMDRRIQNDIIDTPEHPLLDLKVESAAWFPKGYDGNFPDDYLLEILVSIRPKDPAKYEVHSGDILSDGYGENRSGDYITTPKGTGPVSEMMQDPSKALLLFGKQPVTYLINGSHTMGIAPTISSFDYAPDGNLLYYCSYPINDDVYDAIRTTYADAGRNVTFHYKDDSWLWNAQGAEAGFVQSGSVAFTVKLPD